MGVEPKKGNVLGKLELDMTVEEAIITLAEGNPGAKEVLEDLVERGGEMSLLLLDDYEIYGDGIWLLYRDIAKGDIVNVQTLLTASQRGVGGISRERVRQAVVAARSLRPIEAFDYDSLVTILLTGEGPESA